MLKKGSKLYSVSKLKCPRCHEGDLYLTQNAYNLKDFDKMHKYCLSCSQKYDIEPGFYLGAMYVSYILTVFVSGISALVLFFLFKINIALIVGFNLALLLFLAPVVFRFSRAVWIIFFVHFDSEKTL